MEENVQDLLIFTSMFLNIVLYSNVFILMCYLPTERLLEKNILGLTKFKY